MAMKMSSPPRPHTVAAEPIRLTAKGTTSKAAAPAKMPAARGTTHSRQEATASVSLPPTVAVMSTFDSCRSPVTLPEYTERMKDGPMGNRVARTLAVGVALQLVVGATGGLLLAGLDRAGEIASRAVAARRRPPARDTEAQRWPPAIPAPGHRPRSALLIRGPPIRA